MATFENAAGNVIVAADGFDVEEMQDDDSILWTLPDEIIIVLLSFLDIGDLCTAMMTCRRLNKLGVMRAVQSKVSFVDDWPDSTSVHLFSRAAYLGNYEASIKLGVASLYGEGIAACAKMAGEMLSFAEQYSKSFQPFVWLLFRPPWSSDSCSKASIFKDMQTVCLREKKNIEAGNVDRRLCGMSYCVAKALAMNEDVEVQKSAKEWFELSASLGCGDAAVELAKLSMQSRTEDRAAERVMLLRRHANVNAPSALLLLCQEYAKENYGGLAPVVAQGVVRDTVAQYARAEPLVERVQRDMDKKGKMRYILMDWLVEVADLKLFSRETLYITITLVDRFLRRCDITRRTLQLLGIASMVIASRYVEEEVITIREAAWLTDNTYRYEEVVQTIGQTLFAVNGNLRVVTQLDFIHLYASIANLAPNTTEMVHFVSELSLLYIPFGTHAPSHLAAAVLYLTLFGLGYKDCWTDRLAAWSGVTLRDIAPLILAVQQSVFRNDSVTDHRGIELSAVKDRYVRKVPEDVARFEAPSAEALRKALECFLVSDAPAEAGAGAVTMQCADEGVADMLHGYQHHEQQQLVAVGAGAEAMAAEFAEDAFSWGELAGDSPPPPMAAAFEAADSLPVPMTASSTCDDSLPAAMDQNEDADPMCADGSTVAATSNGSGRAFANITNMQAASFGPQPSKRARVTRMPSASSSSSTSRY